MHFAGYSIGHGIGQSRHRAARKMRVLYRNMTDKDDLDSRIAAYQRKERALDRGTYSLPASGTHVGYFETTFGTRRELRVIYTVGKRFMAPSIPIVEN